MRRAFTLQMHDNPARAHLEAARVYKEAREVDERKSEELRAKLLEHFA